MAYIQGDGRSQGTLFPVVLDDLVPTDHVCHVIDAFVERLPMSQLGFERAEAADTGRPGYDPRDLLRLYLYGYLNQIRSSGRLEAECRRNVELMWLLGGLNPDQKSIAEFRRLHRDAITAAGAELVRFARECGLIRGEWIAIDGSKFRAVASIDATRERVELQRYLDKVEKADREQQTSIDHSAVQAALEKLKQHPEPDANFMLVRQVVLPAYNVQTAVDAEHAIIVAHSVTLDASDIRCLKPMADAAKEALQTETLQVVADAGYSNGEQIAQCEEAGITPFVPVMRTVNNHGDGTLFIIGTTGAVGTTIADRPPHTAVRAHLCIRLLQRMSVVEVCTGYAEVIHQTRRLQARRHRRQWLISRRIRFVPLLRVSNSARPSPPGLASGVTDFGYEWSAHTPLVEAPRGTTLL